MKGIHEKQTLEVFRRLQVSDLGCPHARLSSGCIGRGTSPQSLTIGNQEVSDDRAGLVRLGRGLDECTSAEKTNGTGHGMGKPLSSPQPCVGSFLEEPSFAKGRGRGAGGRALEEMLGSLREGVTPGAGRRAIDEMLGNLRHGLGRDAGGRESEPQASNQATKIQLPPSFHIGQDASNCASASQGATGKDLLQCSGKEHSLSRKLRLSEKIGVAGRGRGPCLVGPSSTILRKDAQLPQINSSVNLTTGQCVDKLSAVDVDSDDSLIAESNQRFGINAEEDYTLRLCSGGVDVLAEFEVFVDRGTYTSTTNECQTFGLPASELRKQYVENGGERPSHANSGGVSDDRRGLVRQGSGLGEFSSGKRQDNSPGLSRGQQPSVPKKHFPLHEQKNGAGHGNGHGTERNLSITHKSFAKNCVEEPSFARSRAREAGRRVLDEMMASFKGRELPSNGRGAGRHGPEKMLGSLQGCSQKHEVIESSLPGAKVDAGGKLLCKPDHNVSKQHCSAIAEKPGVTGELVELRDREPLLGMKLKIGMLGRGRGKCEEQTSTILHNSIQLPETADSVNAANANEYITRQGLDRFSAFEIDSDTRLVAECDHKLESCRNWEDYSTSLCSGEEGDESDSLVGAEISTDDMCQKLRVPLQSSDREVKLESQGASDDRLDLVRSQLGLSEHGVANGQANVSVPKKHDTECSGLLGSSSDGKSPGVDGMLDSRRASDPIGKSSIEPYEYPRGRKEPLLDMKLRVSERIGMVGRGRGKSLEPNSTTS